MHRHQDLCWVWNQENPQLIIWFVQKKVSYWRMTWNKIWPSRKPSLSEHFMFILRKNQKECMMVWMTESSISSHILFLAAIVSLINVIAHVWWKRRLSPSEIEAPCLQANEQSISSSEELALRITYWHDWLLHVSWKRNTWTPGST